MTWVGTTVACSHAACALSLQEQAARVDRYKALLAPFILRRLKSEVATQLIAKKHHVQVRVQCSVWCGGRSGARLVSEARRA